MRFSKRTEHIDISGIRRMFELSRGEGVINLGLGEPDFPIPDESKRAVLEALDQDLTHYTPGKGLPVLRELIVQRLKRNGINASPEEIIVTSGASEALEISLLSLVDEGDEVLIPDPGFVSYSPLTRIAGGVPIPYPVHESHSFEADPKDIEERITTKTRVIVINSPGNPTGAVTAKAAIKRIAKLADEHGIPVISDEVYDQIIYESNHHSVGRYTDLAVTVNSFSKTYAMTGLRLGYLHAKEDVVEEMLKIHQYVQASTCSLSQAAAIAALESGTGFTRSMVKELKSRRDLIVGLLNDIEGVSCIKPRGAFYVFPNVSALGSSAEIAMEILKEAGVIVTPGSAFGENGEGYLRLSYATSEENIHKGIERINEHLNIYMD